MKKNINLILSVLFIISCNSRDDTINDKPGKNSFDIKHKKILTTNKKTIVTHKEEKKLPRNDLTNYVAIAKIALNSYSSNLITCENVLLNLDVINSLTKGYVEVFVNTSKIERLTFLQRSFSNKCKNFIVGDTYFKLLLDRAKIELPNAIFSIYSDWGDFAMAHDKKDYAIEIYRKGLKQNNISIYYKENLLQRIVYAYNLKKDYNNFEKEAQNYYQFIFENNNRFNKAYLSTAIKYYTDALCANKKGEKSIQLLDELKQKGYKLNISTDKINAIKNGKINTININYSPIYPNLSK